MRDREIVRKDMEELYLGNLGTVEFDLEHPERSRQVRGFMGRELNRSLSLRPNREDRKSVV